MQKKAFSKFITKEKGCLPEYVLGMQEEYSVSNIPERNGNYHFIYVLQEDDPYFNEIFSIHENKEDAEETQNKIKEYCQIKEAPVYHPGATPEKIYVSQKHCSFFHGNLQKTTSTYKQYEHMLADTLIKNKMMFVEHHGGITVTYLPAHKKEADQLFEYLIETKYNYHFN